MYKVYGDINSGNCYKIKLLMALLDVDHEWIHLDVLQAQTQTAEFRSKNPNAKIPALELPDGKCLSESNAILNFLADDCAYLPAEAYARAKVLQWQFFEQYSHEPYIAVARFIKKYLGLPAEREAEYCSRHDGGYKALAVMELQLATTPYLVGANYSIADISLYAYTHVAHEGGFDLTAYPAIQQWLQRISAHPKHVTMEQFG